MQGALKGLAAAAVLLVLLAYFRGGSELVVEGLELSLRTLVQALPLIIAAFLLTGQLQAFLSKEWMDKLLQKFSGIKGILFSAAAGGLFPGPPYVYYPFLSGFKEKGIPFYLFFSFLAGKHVYDVARLPMEISLINPGIALLRNLITIPIPILIGLLSRRLFSDKTVNDFFNKDFFNKENT